MSRATMPQFALWLGLLALLVIVNALIISRSIATLYASELMMARNLETINALTQTFSTLQDIETGQRGYLITGEPTYLEPYTSARARVGDQIALLKALTADSPTQQGRIADLERRIASRLDELQTTINLRRTQGFAAAQQVVLAGHGRQQMDTIRALIADMQAEEGRERDRQRDESQFSAERATTTLALVVALSIISVGAVGYRLQRDAVTRARIIEDLRLQREWFAVTLASIGDAVITTDTNGMITFMNEVAEKLTGWSHREVLGRHHMEVFKIINEVTRAAVESPVSVVMREGVIANLASHTLLISKSGTEILIDDSGAPICDKADQMIGVVLVFRDIRQRRRTEYAQQLLVDAGATLTGTLEVDALLTTVARLIVPRYADLCVVFLVAEDDMIHRRASVHVDPEAEAHLRELQRHAISRDSAHLAAQAIRTGQTLLNPPIPEQSLSDLAADAEERRRRLMLAPPSQIIVPLAARGQTLGAIAFGRLNLGHAYAPEDLLLAQELGLRIALAIQNATLYQAAQMAIGIRDQFLSIAAHELKTPLTTILGHVQMILRRAERESGLSERDVRSFTTVASQAKRLNTMVTELFDLTRIESGQLMLRCAPLDLAMLVQQAGDELLLPLGNPPQLIYESADTPLIINGDAMRLDQVFLNLIANALKYDPSGAPVRIRLERRGDMAYVAVIDQGIGIPAAALPQIFQRFYRAPNAEARHISGLGIGLYIVQEIIALHGGTVDIVSVEGEGSTFSVLLPLVAHSEA